MYQPIIMPLPEVADRFTIAELKLERLSSDQADPDDLQQQVDYYRAGVDFSNQEIRELVAELKAANSDIWHAEAAIRAGKDEALGLEEIGRRALRIRDLNRVRVAIKNQLAKVTGSGFEDVKMNHCSASRRVSRKY